MLAAITTVLFLATLWLVTGVAFQIVRESGGKVMAALNGRSILATASVDSPIAVRVSLRARPRPTIHAQPQWRAAA